MLSSSAFWQTQHLVHGKNSNALPGALLLVAGVLVVYRHMTEETWEGNQLKTFLALIMIQMLPLVLIELKISSCQDPMALLSRFGAKVLLMHACFLCVRAGYNATANNTYWDIASFLGACVALHVAFGFRLGLRALLEHRDVGGLLVLAMITAVIEESLSQSSRFRGSFDYGSLTISACNYAELLAFVPAVWIVFREGGESKLSPSFYENDTSTRCKANYFFAFLVAFYISEDLGSLSSLWGVLPLAAMGHTAHFLLVLDFAGFMLAHLYSPEKIKEGLANLRASFGAGTLV